MASLVLKKLNLHLHNERYDSLCVVSLYHLKYRLFHIQGESANKRDSIYWNTIRPIPLTKAEVEEYRLKDSLQQVWKSKAYQDSLDRISNKPSLGMLFTGYSYRNSHKKWRLSIPSPLTTTTSTST